MYHGNICKESTFQVPIGPDKVQPCKVSHVMPTIVIVLVAYSPLISHKRESCFISSLDMMLYANNLHILVSQWVAAFQTGYKMCHLPC